MPFLNRSVFNLTTVGNVAAAAIAIAVLSACASSAGIGTQAQLIDAAPWGLQNPSLNTDTTTARIGTEPVPAPPWWQSFNDTQLNRLVDTALAQHPSLRIAQARLALAQASSAVADSASGPKLNGSVDLTRQR